MSTQEALWLLVTSVNTVDDVIAPFFFLNTEAVVATNLIVCALCKRNKKIASSLQLLALKIGFTAAKLVGSVGALIQTVTLKRCVQTHT